MALPSQRDVLCQAIDRRPKKSDWKKRRKRGRASRWKQEREDERESRVNVWKRQKPGTRWQNYPHHPSHPRPPGPPAPVSQGKARPHLPKQLPCVGRRCWSAREGEGERERKVKKEEERVSGYIRERERERERGKNVNTKAASPKFFPPTNICSFPSCDSSGFVDASGFIRQLRNRRLDDS